MPLECLRSNNKKTNLELENILDLVETQLQACIWPMEHLLITSHNFIRIEVASEHNCV